MNNNYFKVTYQGVRELVNVIVFVIVMLIISSKLLIIISEPKWFESVLVGMEITHPATLMAYILVGVGFIWLLYFLLSGIVSLAYWLFAYNTGWYGSLTDFSIRVPLTKNQYWEIENHPKFTRKLNVDTKTEFDYSKLNKWVSDIIEKEINKLTKRQEDRGNRISTPGKPSPNSKPLPKDNEMWHNLK